MRYYKLIGILIPLILGCQNSSTHQTGGAVFGTTYQIIYQGKSPENLHLKQELDSIFKMLNQSMSTYDPNSLISRFNRGKDSLLVDDHFAHVFELSESIWKLSEGAFDPTVGPLVNAYGFGNSEALSDLNPARLDSLKEFIGFQKVRLLPSGWLLKQHPSVALDFNAIAKGYAVDVVADWFETQNIDNYLVEIGGEIRVRGLSPKSNKPWRVAIDDPQQEKYRAFIQTLDLGTGALATSGNYRKFRIDSITGAYYVHTIDPRSAQPVISTILSVSVTAPLCSVADAWATALMVLPLETGQQLIASDPNLEALWIVADGNQLHQIPSQYWDK